MSLTSALPKITYTGSRVATPVAATAPTASADPANTNVYWVGADGNIWLKGSNGVQNMGKGIAGNENGFDAAGGSGQARQIADPNPPANIGVAPAAPTSGGSGTSYPDLSGAIEILRQNISALDPIYQSDVARAIQNYDIANNERQTNFDKSKVASDNSAISNDQSVLQSRNAINKNARTSSEDILSILGALGMTGSTTDKALTTIADKSNGDMNTANYGYGKNKQNILQSWNDFVNSDANQQKQLVDSKNYNIAQAGITRDTAKKDALSQIASNKIQMGQGTSDILGEMAGVNNNIASLSNVPKVYNGTTPTYAAPAISTILGTNMAKFDVTAGSGAKKTAPKLVKVNEQTGSGDKYGLVQ